MKKPTQASIPHLVAGLVLATAMTLALVACSQPMSSDTSSSAGTSASSSSATSSTGTGYTVIKPSEAKSMIDAGNVTVVDVRTQSEYEDAHIEGAVLVPLDTIGDTDIAALPDKDATLIVYCRTGVRSAQASAALVKLGYTHVYDMDGGITSWTYGTVSGASS